MIKILFKIILLLFSVGLSTGCGIGHLTYSQLIGFKPDRQIKHDSKKIRKREVLLYAHYEGTQNGAHIKLRTDNYFDFFGIQLLVGHIMPEPGSEITVQIQLN